ncbi:MAG TPA: hypothetical protein VI854_00860 [Acidimicrobiia bacterium]|nr:hypothetical protein [Acidimicrobiia bacterium]
MKRMLTVVAVVAVLGMAGCDGGDGGRDDAGNGGGEQTARSGERYCELIGDLDKASASLDDLPDDPTPEEAQRVFADFVEDNQDLLDDLVEVAPEEIATDVEAFIAAFRKAATEGDFTAIAEADNARIDEYESQHC